MNEIVTFGKTYQLTDGIKVFARSAKKVPDCVVTVIGIDLSDDTIDFLQREGVRVVDGRELAV